MALGDAAALPGVARAVENKAASNKKQAKPAEEMIRELYTGLTDDQKKAVVLPWDHGTKDGKGKLTRLGMYNAPIGKTIGDSYTKPQQELVQKILRSICSDDDGYRCITRKGTFDGSRYFQGCANIFGARPQKKFAWVFTGHHLTVPYNGNSKKARLSAAPCIMATARTVTATETCSSFRPRACWSVFSALSEKQAQVAVSPAAPASQPSVQFRPADKPKPGLSFGEMNKDHAAVRGEKVMRNILSPYHRKEDADEVMRSTRQGQRRPG